MRKIVIISLSLFAASTLAFPQTTKSAKDILNAVTKTVSGSLSNDQIASGLKNALSVGTVNACLNLNKMNGFYKDALVKILLPPEAQKIVSKINYIPGGKQMMDDVVLRMNRAAEDAVVEAKPIFTNAITSMTITDAVGILQGKDDAATQYLRKSSYTPLVNAFAPKIQTSLGKKIVGNVSATDAWKTLMTANNKAAGTVSGKLVGLKPVQADLSQYVTEKALDGVFLKVSGEEAKIRKDPAARVNDILKNVFGSLDKK